MNCRFNSDGTFNLSGIYYTLAGCRPSINGRPVSAVSVCAAENYMSWDLLVDGLPCKLTLSLRKEGEELFIGSAISGQGLAKVHDISPISGEVRVSAGPAAFGGEVSPADGDSFAVSGGKTDSAGGDSFAVLGEGAGRVDRVFVQGKGMEGPSGYFKVSGQSPLRKTLAIRNSADGKRPFSDAAGYDSFRSTGLIVLTDTRKNALLLFASDHRHFENRYSFQRRESLFEETSDLLTAGFCLENASSGSAVLPEIAVREFAADTAVSANLTFSADAANSPAQAGRGASASGRARDHESALDRARDHAAHRIAADMGARHDKPNAFHWSSWYYLYSFFDEDLLSRYLRGFQEKDPGFRYVQIDDGYTDHQGDWLVPGKFFPHGLKAAAGQILQAGFLPGIWVAPFMVGNETQFFRDHPDWMLKNPDGSIYLQMTSYNEPKAFGSRDTEYYVLDTSNPEALDYLRQVFCTLYEWGFRLFKTDFLFWNMHDSAHVKRFDPSMTSVEIYRKTMQTIREAIGEDSYLLGCISPFLPAVGIVDGMRIAGDVGAQWEGAYGPQNLIRETVADSYFNHIYWQNDPDAAMVRSFDLHLSEMERESVLLFQAMSGGAVTTSDPVHKLSRESLELLRFIRPDEARHIPELPRPEAERPDLVMIHRLRNRGLYYVLNRTDEALTVSCDLSDMKKAGFSYWKRFRRTEIGCLAGAEAPYYLTTLHPHESALLILSKEPITEDPENLWV